MLLSNGWIWDSISIVGYFALILTIGLWPRKQGSLEQFSLGGREMPWWAVTASILAAEISAATFLGGPEEGFNKRNFTYAQLAIGTVLARAIVAYLFIKPYYQYNVVSIYEFLRIRFGNRTRNAASFIFLLTRLLASGTRLYVAGVIVVLGLEFLTGVKPTPHQEIAIYIAVLTGIAALTTVYTAIGGIKAVVWTDFIQAALMFSALGYAMVQLLHAIPGGWNGALTHLRSPGDLSFWNTGLSGGGTLGHQIKGILEEPYTLWSALIGSTFVTMATHGTDQDMVQRMLTAKDYHRSRLAVVCSGLIDIPVVLVVLTVGILLYVFYQTNVDPNQPGKNIFAYWIVHQVPPGARGLMIAGILSTAMGSLSTALNALATSFVKDWWMPHFKTSDDEKSHVRAVRWSTVVFSALLVLIGALTARAVVIYPDARIIPIVLGIFGYTYGSLLGVFLVGLMTKNRGSDTGNLWGMAGGFIVVAILSGLASDLVLALTGTPLPQPHWLPVIAFPWRVFFGTVTTMAIALCFRQTPAETKNCQG